MPTTSAVIVIGGVPLATYGATSKVMRRITEDDAISGRITRYALPSVSSFTYDDRSLGKVHTRPRTQFCITCGTEKDYEDFHRDSKMITGRKSECKICRSVKRNQRYKSEKVRKLKNAYIH